MAIQECGNGHLYDTDQHARCPYCQGGGNRINFGGPNFGAPSFGGVNNSSDIGKTVGAGVQFPQPSYQPQEEIGATVAPSDYRNSRREDDAGKTVGVFQKNKQFEPVVGWIVCIEGANKGKDYRLFAKTNTVGRTEKNDICIKGDDTISREKHAKIDYDEKHNGYYLIPAEATNTIYINDKPVYQPTELLHYDVIELGEGKFIFIPLCTKQFDWNTGLDTGLNI